MVLIHVVQDVAQCWGGWSFMGFGWSMFFWPLILVLLATGFYFTLVPRRRVVIRTVDDALSIARNRLSRGEISAEEFEEIKRHIQT